MVPRLLLLSCTLLLAVGCQTGPLYVSPQFNAKAPRLVAVLPPSNETSELVGEKLCHILMTRNIHTRGYRAISRAQVMSYLKTKGISDGGQLGLWNDSGFTWTFPRHLPAKKICEELKVDGLVVGHLSTWSDLVTGYYNQRKVEIGWALVDKEGTVLWMDNKMGVTADLHTSNKAAARAAAAHAARKFVVEKITEAPLYHESLMATRNNLRTLPYPVR